MATEPQLLWEPSAERQAASRLRAFLDKHGFATYDEAWRWSVGADTAGDFWRAAVADLGIRWTTAPTQALDRDHPEPARPGLASARWFPSSTLNYAQHALAPPPSGPASAAVIARSQTAPCRELTWAELSDLVARVRNGLRSAGLQKGDRVVAYLPNIPEALAAMLAAASLGAIWSSCSPEMGAAGVLDRFGQLDPAVLIAVDGYRYGGRTIERSVESEDIRRGLPTLVSAIQLAYLEPDRSPPAGWRSWDELTAAPATIDFEAVEFEHPLCVLYSSGTTGRPKAIVHGHGGILLEHAKALAYHFDLGPGKRFFWYTTTGWMMWNFCVSGLVVGCPVVLFDGDPNWPGPGALWELIAATGTTCAGVGSAYLVACAKAGLQPGTTHDLSALETLGATGSPLPAAAARWAYDAVSPDLLLGSFSGGTDVCTGFVGPSPLHPVWAGEISCRCLGAGVEIFDDAGEPVVGEEGELVLTAPLPSMPVSFWGDKDGALYNLAYFHRYPGVWAHGDRALLSERGTVEITGRSDGTLNRGGVRMGTAELYAVVEGLDTVADSLAVHLEDPEGGPGELWLFVVPADGATSGEELAAEIKAALRHHLSPRHVPDRIVEVPSVPRTLSGKKLEVPVKKLLSGVPLERAVAIGSVANPESLEPLAALAQRG